MTVGTLTVRLMIRSSQSLKDKRRVIHGLKQRIRNRFNVSVSEVGHGDAHQRCRLGIAMVSGEARGVHSQFDKIVDMVRATPGLTLLEYEREVF